MSERLRYATEEILAEPEYVSRHRRGNVLFHGGFDDAGRYLPPRSRHRVPAIEAWTRRLSAAGHPTEVVSLDAVRRPFFPSVAQAKLLLRHGANDAITRILTIVGVTEGFGNDGIRAMPRPALQPFFRESIDGTCLDHLYRGLMEAHGNDEAGRGEEAGHDLMWYEIREVALDHPRVTREMFENLPIAPPPGYSGPARPSPEAIGVSDLARTLFPNVDVIFEVLVTALTQLLVIELGAYTTFSWARELLSDPEVSAAREWAPRMVDCIQADENIHVAYLQCALAEARARTIVGLDGNDVSGAELVDPICRKIVDSQTGARRDRMLAYRMRQIREELGHRPDGAEILREFEQLGPVPDLTEAA